MRISDNIDLLKLNRCAQTGLCEITMINVIRKIQTRRKYAFDVLAFGRHDDMEYRIRKNKSD